MKYDEGVSISKNADATGKYYLYLGYRDFYYGPFETEEQIIETAIEFDRKDIYWRYDGFQVVEGCENSNEIKTNDDIKNKILLSIKNVAH